MTISADAADLEVAGDPSHDEEITGRCPLPDDVLWTVVLGVLTLLLVAVAEWVPDAVLEFERDLISLFGFLNTTIERILVGTSAVVAALALLLIWGTPLTTRWSRRSPAMWEPGRLACAPSPTSAPMST